MITILKKIKDQLAASIGLDTMLILAGLLPVILTTILNPLFALRKKLFEL